MGSYVPSHMMKGLEVLAQGARQAKKGQGAAQGTLGVGEANLEWTCASHMTSLIPSFPLCTIWRCHQPTGTFPTLHRLILCYCYLMVLASKETPEEDREFL